MRFIRNVSLSVAIIPPLLWVLIVVWFENDPVLSALGFGLACLAFAIASCSRFFSHEEVPEIREFAEAIHRYPQGAFWGGIFFALAGIFLGCFAAVASLGESSPEAGFVIDYRVAILGAIIFTVTTLYAGAYIAAFAASEGLKLSFGQVLTRLVIALGLDGLVVFFTIF